MNILKYNSIDDVSIGWISCFWAMTALGLPVTEQHLLVVYRVMPTWVKCNCCHSPQLCYSSWGLLSACSELMPTHDTITTWLSSALPHMVIIMAISGVLMQELKWVHNLRTLNAPLQWSRKLNCCWVCLFVCVHILLFQYLSADISIKGKFQKCSVPEDSSSACEDAGF